MRYWAFLAAASLAATLLVTLNLSGSARLVGNSISAPAKESPVHGKPKPVHSVSRAPAPPAYVEFGLVGLLLPLQEALDVDLPLQPAELEAEQVLLGTGSNASTSRGSSTRRAEQTGKAVKLNIANMHLSGGRAADQKLKSWRLHKSHGSSELQVWPANYDMRSGCICTLAFSGHHGCVQPQNILHPGTTSW